MIDCFFPKSHIKALPRDPSIPLEKRCGKDYVGAGDNDELIYEKTGSRVRESTSIHENHCSYRSSILTRKI